MDKVVYSEVSPLVFKRAKTTEVVCSLYDLDVTGTIENGTLSNVRIEKFYAGPNEVVVLVEGGENEPPLAENVRDLITGLTNVLDACVKESKS